MRSQHPTPPEQLSHSSSNSKQCRLRTIGSSTSVASGGVRAPGSDTHPGAWGKETAAGRCPSLRWQGRAPRQRKQQAVTSCSSNEVGHTHRGGKEAPGNGGRKESQGHMSYGVGVKKKGGPWKSGGPFKLFNVCCRWNRKRQSAAEYQNWRLYFAKRRWNRKIRKPSEPSLNRNWLHAPQRHLTDLE